MGAVSVDQRAPIGPLSAGAKLGRYEILCKLATGGMAIVYVARVQGVAGFERLVAIKVLHANLAHEDEFISMFLDEARLAASIRHPNVVPTIDISDSEEAGYFIVMEYIEGDHLGALLSSSHKAEEKLPLPITLRIIADALGGLGAAHDLSDDTGKSLHLVHRDVSPHNIMVGRDGVVRLTDFGVAKAEDRLTHTRDGQVKGKLAYMAPEQAACGQTDKRSDLFSMGVILWECVTGQRLFRAENTAATLHKLLHDPIAAPSSIDPQLAGLDPLLAKALHRDPNLRFQTAEEFAQAIEEVAPALGGLSSLRGVARVCKHYTATKLKREKKLIDDALRALRPDEQVDDPAPELEAENSSPSATEISVTSETGESLSASKISGVFSHDTIPGTRKLTPTRRRADDAPSSAGSSEAPTRMHFDGDRPNRGAEPTRADRPLNNGADPALRNGPAGSAAPALRGGFGGATVQAAPRRSRRTDTLELPAATTNGGKLVWGSVFALCFVAVFWMVRPARERVRVQIIPPAQLTVPVLESQPASSPGTSSGKDTADPKLAPDPEPTPFNPVLMPPEATPRHVTKRDDGPSRATIARRARRERAENARNERGDSRSNARNTSAASERSDVIPNPYHN